MRKWWLLLILLLTMAGGAGWWFRDPLVTWVQAKLQSIQPELLRKPKPDPEKYAVLTVDLENWRKSLAKRYSAAKTSLERATIESEARALLEKCLPAMMHCWLGTRWDFNGTASEPGKGKIACGYFVATVLKDAGFQVDRYQLAQQPSGNILRTFLPKDSCELTVGKNYQEFATSVAQRPPGVYVVGLDTHVAFIIIRDGKFRFIHSSGSQPWCVVDEGPDNAGVLQRSSWRMLGNLTAEPDVIRQWLKARKIAVHGT